MAGRNPAQVSLAELFGSEVCRECEQYRERLQDANARIASLEAMVEIQAEELLNRTESLDDRRQKTIESWQKKHIDNPNIWAALVEVCADLESQGREHYTISAVWEIMRLHKHLQIKTEEPFKLANAHRAIYARMLRALFPNLAGLFTMNASQFDDVEPWRDVWHRNPDRQAYDRNPPRLRRRVES